MSNFTDRLAHAWNAFMNKDPTSNSGGRGYSYRPDRPRLTRGNERSIVTSVYNRIAMDTAAIDIKHIRLDRNGRYKEDIVSPLNDCLTLRTNIDQTARAFFQDVVMSLLDEGSVAIIPVDTDTNPNIQNAFDIYSMRTGRILEWYPDRIKASVYNEKTGIRQEIIILKKNCVIVENPLYSVMNEPNSTMQRLIRKLNLLDAVDEQSSSGKLDLIIQLPYVIKTPARRQQAEQRRKDIEDQLAGSKYGIAYTDGTEHITQLNRSLENNLMGQIEYLTSMLYSQLGITQGVLDGTADEKTMLNYYNRTIEPIISSIVDEMKSKFLTKTARTQGQSIAYFRDPFKLVPVNDIAEIADKFTRNEIMSSNEIRQIIGMKPSDDPKADELINSNINQANSEETNAQMLPFEEEMSEEEYSKSMSELEDLDSELDDLESSLDDDLKHYASPYYDPVKAHEYYMKNRELKGRSSTGKLTDEGKAAAKYVKNQLNEEQKSKVEAHKKETDSEIESLKSDMTASISAHSNALKNQIAAMSNRIKSLTGDQKVVEKARLKSEIAVLRNANNKKKLELQMKFKSSSEKLRAENTANSQNLKSEYDAKYEEELSKIRSQYTKASTTKKRR